MFQNILHSKITVPGDGLPTGMPSLLQTRLPAAFQANLPPSTREARSEVLCLAMPVIAFSEEGNHEPDSRTRRG
jgi:hypothetical protein